LDLLEVDTLVGRHVSGDLELARERVKQLQNIPAPGSLMFVPCTPATLRRSLDAIEEAAHSSPLDCDRAFAKLADLARFYDQPAIAERAAGRSAFYRAGRIAAASRHSTSAARS
jgi:hypothetical protein